MRVLYVWDAEYPWDVRTEKVCLALVNAGHQVVITARNLHGKRQTEPHAEGTVERLPAGPRLLRRFVSFPAFFNPLWFAHLDRMIRKHRIELVIVRDLPLAPTALLAARGRMPVLLDMAENYPAMMRDVWTDGRHRRFDFLVRNPTVVAFIERLVIARVNHIITVVEESSQRLFALGVPRNRVSVVSNTPPADRATNPAGRRPGGPLRVVYLGLMEHHRGIVCVLDAMSILNRAEVPVHLDLVGDGRDFDHIRRHAVRIGLTEGEVTFHGRLPHDHAIAIVSRSHVGLVPHEARDSWNTTIPNKLFDYMAAGLTVITSDARPAARLVAETGAGLVYRSGEAGQLAECIRSCLDPARREEHGIAGRSAIRSRYNWESDARELLDVIARVMAGRRTVSPTLDGRVGGA